MVCDRVHVNRDIFRFFIISPRLDQHPFSDVGILICIKKSRELQSSGRRISCVAEPGENLCGFASVLFAELVHAAGSIHDLLFAGEKWMAT